MGTRQAVRGHRAEKVRKQRGGRRRRIKPIKLSREIPLLIVLALGLALLIKTFLVQAFYIPSPSMENTLLPGDRVLVNKISPWFGWQPKRGEIVVFEDPDHWLGDTPPPRDNPIIGAVRDVFTFIGLLPSDDQHDLIKRVIGVPGDVVRCCDAQGRITVDGIALHEQSYLRPGNVPSTQRFRITVPAGRLWVMGDNRGDSADSRAHMDEPGDGTVPIDDVVGHAFVLIWPLNRFTGLGVPGTFGQPALHALSALGSSPAPATSALVLAPALLLWRRRGQPWLDEPRSGAWRREDRSLGRRIRLSATNRVSLPVRFRRGGPPPDRITGRRGDGEVWRLAPRVRSRWAARVRLVVGGRAGSSMIEGAGTSSRPDARDAIVGRRPYGHTSSGPRGTARRKTPAR
jgi:signal peptidase I